MKRADGGGSPPTARPPALATGLGMTDIFAAGAPADSSPRFTPSETATIPAGPRYSQGIRTRNTKRNEAGSSRTLTYSRSSLPVKAAAAMVGKLALSMNEKIRSGRSLRIRFISRIVRTAAARVFPRKLSDAGAPTSTIRPPES